ncbi:hypothetical protein NL676_032687 [Syzygium grande]|nr:hypothetical protein NL676_032687 [Syzygium grande]
MATVCPVAPLHQEANTSRLKIRSLKSLAESSKLTSIPSHCTFTNSTSDDQAVHPDHDDSIPIVVINHGVPESQMKAMVNMLTGFFDLTEEEKMEFKGKHVLDPIRCGTSFNASVHKVFSWRDFLRVSVHPKFHCPAKPEGFSEVLTEYSGVVRKLARGLLEGVSESLGLEPGYIDKAMNMDSSLQILEANLYPPCPQPELTMGVPPHADHGLLTIVLQNGIGGLQVHRGGKWVEIDPIPNAFLVNTGDHLKIMSNGKYKSVLHRAVVNDKATRMSIALSNGPLPDTVMTPVEQLVDGKNNRVVHIGMKYKDFLELQQSIILGRLLHWRHDSVRQWSIILDGKNNRVVHIGMQYKDFLELQQSIILDGKSGLDGVVMQPELSELQQSSVLYGKSGLDGVIMQPELSELQQNSLLYGKLGLDGVLVQPELSELQ